MQKIDNVVRAYIAKRDILEKTASEHRAQEAALRAELETIESWLLRQMYRDGVEGYNTPHGTAYHTKYTSVTVADWPTILAYARENDAFDLIKPGVNKTAVVQLLDAGGALPPGVKYSEGKRVAVRRA